MSRRTICHRLSASALSFASLAWTAPALRAQLAVVGAAVQEREAAPGASYEGTITIRNDGAAAQEARVFQTDYAFFADGRTLYPQAASRPRSNAGWVAVSPARLVVPPGQTVDVRYRVVLPAATDSLRGTYWSLVMVEGVSAPAATTTSPDRREITMRPTMRYGVQVVTHVRATGEPRIAIANAAARKEADGSGSFEVDLANDGDRAGRPAVTLELYDGDGRLVVKQSQTRGLLYPGTSLRQRFVLGALAAGAYRAVLVADAGGESVFGAQYPLRF